MDLAIVGRITNLIFDQVIAAISLGQHGINQHDAHNGVVDFFLFDDFQLCQIKESIEMSPYKNSFRKNRKINVTL